jgi:hypothetical protein
MSPLGRAEAAQRWHDGDHGPDSAMARSTKRVCRDCGFYLPLSGELGTMFGVCGNELSADGQVVDIGYGCGAHSDTPAPAGTGSPAYEPYDDGVLEVVEATTTAAAAEPESEPAQESVEQAAAVAEPAVEATAETEVAPEPMVVPEAVATESDAAGEAVADVPAEPGDPEAT